MDRPHSKRVAWLVLSFVIIVIDQISKWVITQKVFYPDIYGAPGAEFFTWITTSSERLPFRSIEITSYFNLVMAWNPGVSFSLFSDMGASMPLILIILSLVITLLFLYWLVFAPSHFHGFCYALVIGGALGNVFDRARFGAVIDFLDFHLYGRHWPAFNVADMSVVFGICVLIFVSIVFEIMAKQGYRKKLEHNEI